MRLDLASLEIFQCVAREGSVSKAADRLARVQSNVSTRIKNLESRLGVTLFERTRRGLTPTDSGRTLLAYADRMLALADEAVEAVSDSHVRGSLRIGAMESTAAARLPGVLAAYHQRFPGVDLQVCTDTAGGLLGRLRRGEIDVAFVAEPVSDASFASDAVFVEELVLISPADTTDPGAMPDLNGQRLIAFEVGCAYRRYLDEWLLGEGVTPAMTLSVSSYVAILASVAAGDGYAVAPTSVLDALQSASEMRRHRLPRRYRKIRTLMVRRCDVESAKLDALLELCKEPDDRP